MFTNPETKTEENVVEQPAAEKPAAEQPAAESQPLTIESTEKAPETDTKKLSYVEKARLIQNRDPAFTMNIGNGWLGGNGLVKPVFGIDFRLGRKSVFVRAISVGARASIAGWDDIAYESGQYTESYNFGFNFKYHVPMPIKIVQPYFTFLVGVSIRNHYINSNFYDYGYEYEYNSPYDIGGVTDEIVPFVNTGLGCNFMVARFFGFFVEFGYFATGYIQTGLSIKMGPGAKVK